MTKSVQAWILHKQWSGDTSARVNFYTRELGLVNCLCKGGRTPKKQALLQAFQPLWLALDSRHDRYYARSIECNEPSLALSGNALFSGLYLNELLFYVLSPQYTDTDLFDAYVHTMQALAVAKNNQTIEASLRRFEWALLHACGVSFSFREEAKDNKMILPTANYQFIAGEGFIAAKQGILGAHLLALAEDNLHEANTLKAAKIVMRQAIDHLLGGREIKARALYAASGMTS